MSARKSRKEREYELDSRVLDVHYFDLDLKDRIIYLMGIEDHPNEEYDEPGIEYRITNRFVRNINLLTSEDAEKPILVCMKSNGGYWDEGMAIYNSILSTPCPVTILNYTHARSMTSIILQAASKRVMMPDSTFMFHQGTYGDYGTVKQVAAGWEFAKKADERMLDIYVDVMKTSPEGKARSWSRKRIREWLREQMDKKEDVYLTAEEAIAWGFADEMFGGWPTLFEYTEEELLRK